MIDPKDVTKFDRTDAELEEWWLFTTIVAGKTAAVQARLLERFLTSARDNWRFQNNPSASPFEVIRRYSQEPCMPGKSTLRILMEVERVGQYARLEQCWIDSLGLDLRNDPVEAFEAVHGVGPKTARFFLMHSRPDQRLAALDTHILKHLAENGHTVPKSTPTSGKLYAKLEQAFLDLADKAGMSPADYDLMVWKSYAREA